MSLFVGIDPSFTATGVVVLNRDSAVLAAASVKVPAEGRSDIDRALAVANDVQALIEDAGPQQDVRVAIENYSLNSRFRLAMLVTLGTVLRMRLRLLGWAYVDPAPLQVKAYALMPAKTPSKVKPFKECEALWGFKHKSGDVVDAYVLAQIARAAHGAQAVGQLHARQIDVLAKLKVYGECR